VLSPFCGRQDCPNIETVLGRLLLANVPDFINDGIPYHDLFSHEFFRRADDDIHTHAGGRSTQEIHSMYGSDGDVRGVGSGFTGDLAGYQNTGG
jgi:hypothetical protein